MSLQAVVKRSVKDRAGLTEGMTGGMTGEVVAETVVVEEIAVAVVAEEGINYLI